MQKTYSFWAFVEMKITQVKHITWDKRLHEGGRIIKHARLKQLIDHVKEYILFYPWE